MKQIVSFGGGTNSTAMIVGMVQRNEQIDAIAFSDTGGEKPWTYEYIEILSNWLAFAGFPHIATIKAENRHGTLEQECLNMKTLPSVAYGWKTCSDKWKIAPFKKWLKATGWEDVTVCVGFDAGESHRAKRGDEIKQAYTNRYPLIEWGLDRDGCIEIIKAAGLPLPGKSSCFFCPNSKLGEIKALPADLKERAIAIERNSEAHSIKGLGRSFAWEYIIQDHDAQVDLFIEREMPCGCYDGGAA